MGQITVGDTLPDATFTAMTADGPAPRTTADVFGGRKVALFAVPGAYTPTCHNNHLPSFLGNHAAFKEAGVDAVACTAVNDVFVLNAWAESTGSKEKIEMLADGSGSFAKAIGMDLDLGAHGLGLRSKRYAMLVDDGTVKALLVEDNPGQAEASTGESLLSAMRGA